MKLEKRYYSEKLLKMTFGLEVKKQMTDRSDRVKCVELHPTEPWVLCALYTGDVIILDHQTHKTIKTFQVSSVPVRAAAFVPRHCWIVTGSDDFLLNVFNYNTLERIRSLEAHSDYIRSLVPHPSQPLLLTASDDMTIKLWNWERGWICQEVYRGHSHYVMEVTFNPRDPNTFATASLDRTVKIWQLGFPEANLTLEGHEKGVNCVQYYPGPDQPLLLSGSDDGNAILWDYHTKACVRILEGHLENVTSVAFHPKLPFFMTGSEDGSIKLWHKRTFRLESTLSYGFERVWSISCKPGSNNIAFGYDHGTILIKVGSEYPVVSMDSHRGLIVWNNHNEIQQADLKDLSEEFEDGEVMPLIGKDMGCCSLLPQKLQHGPGGRFLAQLGGGEFLISTAGALRGKAQGRARQLAWGHATHQYATLNSDTVTVYQNFKQIGNVKVDERVEGIFGGFLLGVKTTDSCSFYHWDSFELIRRIDIQPNHIFWTQNGNLVCLAAEDCFFILKNNMVESDTMQNGDNLVDNNDTAFSSIGTLERSVKSGMWIEDCFVYSDSLHRISYYVGGEVTTLAHLDHPAYILGYMQERNKLYIVDNDMNVFGYTLMMSVIQYQSAVARRDEVAAAKLLPYLPTDQRSRVAHTLRKQGFVKEAFEVSVDPEQRFDLSVELKEWTEAEKLATNKEQWARLGEAALQACDLSLAYRSFKLAKKTQALFTMAVAAGDKKLLKELSDSDDKEMDPNLKYLIKFYLGDTDACLDILIKNSMLECGAFFARSYLPHRMSEVVNLWRTETSITNQRIAQQLADPKVYDNLFPELQINIK